MLAQTGDGATVEEVVALITELRDESQDLDLKMVLPSLVT